MPTLKAHNGIPPIEDGTCEATLMDVEEREATPNSPNQDPWLLWTFVVDDGSTSGLELTASSSMRFGPKSKARGWAEVLLGRKIVDDEEVVLERMLPKDCLVVVRHRDNGYPFVSDVLSRPKAKGVAGTSQGVLV